jgi:HAE1 family hydrophobic/amphiphilic exporter-1
MNLAELAIKRPIFITAVIILSLATGLLAMSRLGIDQFPDITLPVVTVTTPYPGAGPSEVETLVSKPLEDELSTISGLKRLSSENREGYSVVTAEFNLEVDVKYAEQQVRDHVGSTKSKLPDDVKDSTIQRIDPSDQPIIQVSVQADLPVDKLYDLADDVMKPLLVQAPNVGKIEIVGGRKREIHVSLDRNKLKQREISASQVSSRLAGSGQNIPGGKKSIGLSETSYRTLGEFAKIEDIKSMVVNFYSNEVPVRISELGKIEDSLEDETTRAFTNGKPALIINAYKQSGSNTVKVARDLKARVVEINKMMASQPGHPVLNVIRDGAHVVEINVEDVEESIYIGIILAVIVVYLFLANFRSTIITGLALPNSLLGAFILMWAAGYTINIMSLLALTLSVGLLVDDAIVVRENIFRHLEMGKDAKTAALDGTAEVRLAVIATTLTVISVFGPLGFLSGTVGQFFKQFGLTVVFAMLISLFDALTIAPMLSAYFAGHQKTGNESAIYRYTAGAVLKMFVKFQDWLELVYVKVLRVVVVRPLLTLVLSVMIAAGCFSLVKFIPSTFLPTGDDGEFSVSLDLPPGTNIDGMSAVATKVDAVIRKNPEVLVSNLTVGSSTGDPNQASIYIRLVDPKKRTLNTTQVKDKIREQLKPFSSANPLVKDPTLGGGDRAFTLNILGTDQAKLEELAIAVRDKLKNEKGLVDLDLSFRPGKPEFQVRPLKDRTEKFGTSATLIGNEIKTQIEGLTPAKYREAGKEYDIRVRLEDSQRNLASAFHETYIPNLNNSLIKLDNVSESLQTTGPAKITRQDRMKYVQVTADIAAGAGLSNLIARTEEILKNDIKLPPNYRYRFAGQGEDVKDLGTSVAIAMGAGVLFILLVLASLYESFVTPLTIMTAMPLAIAGGFVALFMTHESLNVFSLIGFIMLMGVAVKNSILLVDYAHQAIAKGLSRNEAIIEAGRTRLRPILMTSMALIAGTLPIALGLNEASRQRMSMGIAIIGGLISSTILTLVVVPASFSYIDRFRVWIKNLLGRLLIEDYKSTEK